MHYKEGKQRLQWERSKRFFMVPSKTLERMWYGLALEQKGLAWNLEEAKMNTYDRAWGKFKGCTSMLESLTWVLRQGKASMFEKYLI